MEVSLSYCEGIVACAVQGIGCKGRVGVDIERIAPEILEVVERFTLPSERQELARASHEELTATLFWSFKEAAIKCLGGLIANRRAFEVRLNPGRQSASILVRGSALFESRVEELRGRFRILREHVLVWVSIPPRSGCVRILPGAR